MMLLASISWFGLLVLVIAGWLVLRLAGGCGGQGRSWGGLKLLGIAAIVAGVAVFWIRPSRHVEVDYTQPAASTVIDHDFGAEFSHLDDLVGHPVQVRVHHQGPPRWVFISLGAGLVILGVLMFGRGGNRPVAIKTVTFVGIGAILYAVVTFLGDAPRRSASPRASSSRVVRFDKHDEPRAIERKQRNEREEREEKEVRRRRARHSHAKRPSMRPDRPTGGERRRVDELPPRAGEIPVSKELERQRFETETEEPVAEPAAETEPASPPVGPADEPAAERLAADERASTEPADKTPAPEEPAEPEPVEPTEQQAEEEQAEPAPQQAEEEQKTEPSGQQADEDESEPSAQPEEPSNEQQPPAAPEPAAPAPAAAQPLVEPSKLAAQPAVVPAEPSTALTTESTESFVALENEPRPEWVDAMPGLTGGIYSLPVSSGPFATPPECQGALDREIKSEADQYIKVYLGPEAAALVDIPISYLKDRVKKKEYVERVQPKGLEGLAGYRGHMYQIHALLEFDDEARADFRRQWRRAEVVNRLWYTGGASALVLALLATVYGYLKLEVRTDGAHKGRLQLAATLVALIAVAGVLLVRWAVPF